MARESTESKIIAEGAETRARNQTPWLGLVAVAGLLSVFWVVSAETEPQADPGLQQVTDDRTEPAPQEPEEDFTTVAGLSAATGVKLALLDDGEMILVELGDGVPSLIAVPAPRLDSGLVSLGDSVVYAAQDGRAILWSQEAFSSKPIGPADQVAVSRTLGNVWLGEDRPVEDSSQRVTRWTEVHSDGSVIQSVERTRGLTLRFPDLGWGFTGVYRYTNDPSHQWRWISSGYPVAWGANDIIISECRGEQGCERYWYDPDTGADKGGLLRDIADNFDGEGQARLSPDGRYAAASDGDGVTRIWDLATGETLDVGCADRTGVRWGHPTALMACVTDAGLTVYDLGGKERVIIGGSAAEGAYAFLTP